MNSKLMLALVAIAISGAPRAQDFPKLKPGLWQIERVQTQPADPKLAPMHVEFCTDEATQQEMMQTGQGMMKGMCSKHDFKISGNTGTGESICDMGGTKMTSHSRMTINGTTGYRTEVQTTFDPPLNRVKENTAVVDAKYLGPCKAGQRPGDMMMPNGQTMNMHDMMAGPMKGPPTKGPPPAK